MCNCLINQHLRYKNIVNKNSFHIHLKICGSSLMAPLLTNNDWPLSFSLSFSFFLSLRFQKPTNKCRHSLFHRSSQSKLSDFCDHNGGKFSQRILLNCSQTKAFVNRVLAKIIKRNTCLFLSLGDFIDRHLVLKLN